MVEFGQRIKELRVQRRMTQGEFARRLGVTKSSISSYENGSRFPSYDVLLNMARVFKVSTDFLLGRGDGTTLDVTGLTGEQVMVLRDLAEAYRSVNVLPSLLPGLSEEEAARVLRFTETGQS